jgi:hypothetical protein
MESVNRTFELFKESIELSPSSIFSNDDVKKLIERVKQDVLKLIEEEKPAEAPELTAFKLDVLRAFRDELDDNRYGEYVDLDSAEFQISYDNRVELSNIDINVDELENALERAFGRANAGN